MSARDRRHVGRRLVPPGIAAVFVVALSAGALAADGVPSPAGPRDAPIPRCVPAKNRICGTGTTSPAKAAAQLLAATGRRGLGVATAGGKEGRRAAAKLLAAMGAAPTGTARARTDSEGMRPFGVADRLLDGSSRGAALAPSIGDRVRARVITKRGRITDARTFNWEAAVERCPDPGPPANSHGRARVTGLAVWQLQVDEQRRGGVIVRTIIRLEARLTDVAAHSTRRAELDFIMTESSERTPVIASRQVLVIRNGNSRRVAPMAVVKMTADILAPDVSILFENQGFEAFINRAQAQEPGEPDPTADGPILGRVWKDFTREFVEMVASRTWSLANLAERNWRTPNRCLTLSFDGPTRLRPGQRVELTGMPRAGERPASVRQLLGEGLGSGTWISLLPIRRAKIESLVPRLPLPTSRPWIALTAPGQRWQKGAGPGFDMTLATKAGIAKFKRVYDEGLPDRFAGTVRYSGTLLGAIRTTWSSDVTYTFAEDVSNPNGSRTARYTLTAANVTSFENLIGDCPNKATATGGAIRFGDLELSFAPNGALTYGFVHDVGLGDLAHVPQGPVPPCPPTFPSFGVAFLNTRTRTNALRPGRPDLKLTQTTTGDLSINSIPGNAVTASWELSPT